MQSESQMDEWCSVLRTWALLGAALPPRHTAPDWTAAHRIIEAVQPILAIQAGRLKELLVRSRQMLEPLEDPFEVDLGLHRWLDGEREEAYSDWLEWVVNQAQTPERVFKLFHVATPPTALPKSQLLTKRELCIPYGHADQQGRLDLVIRFGDEAIFVIEVKPGHAESADRAKHKGYYRWLKETQSHPFKIPILLAESADDEPDDPFTFLSWESVCIEMQRLARDINNEGRTTTAAMVLAFVAAVEQNLLEFSVGHVGGKSEEGVTFFDPRIVGYMERVIQNLET